MDITPIRERWNGQMTDRERFNRQMHYQPVDRSFNMEFGYWDENFTQWPMFRDNGITNNHEADRFFSFDKIVTIGGNNWLHPSYEGEIFEETATTRQILNEDGVVAEVPKDGHSTIPHFVRPTIVTPEDWQRVKETRMRVDDPARILDIEALKRAHPEDRDYPLGIWTGSMIGKIRDMLTFEGLAYTLFDYPEMLEDMVETCCQLTEHSLDQLLPNFHFDFASGWEDICFKNGPIITLNFFNDVVVPRYERIGKKLHQYGIDLWYTDCDGDVRALLPGFLKAGINCLFPFEVNGCAHPKELLDEYGQDLRIMGGIDKIALGDGPEAIRTYLESVAPLVTRGGYIPFCDHRCPPNVKPEDYLFYLDLKREMFGM